MKLSPIPGIPAPPMEKKANGDDTVVYSPFKAREVDTAEGSWLPWLGGAGGLAAGAYGLGQLGTELAGRMPVGGSHRGALRQAMRGAESLFPPVTPGTPAAPSPFAFGQPLRRSVIDKLQSLDPHTRDIGRIGQHLSSIPTGNLPSNAARHLATEIAAARRAGRAPDIGRLMTDLERANPGRAAGPATGGMPADIRKALRSRLRTARGAKPGFFARLFGRKAPTESSILAHLKKDPRLADPRHSKAIGVAARDMAAQYGKRTRGLRGLWKLIKKHPGRTAGITGAALVGLPLLLRGLGNWLSRDDKRS